MSDTKGFVLNLSVIENLFQEVENLFKIFFKF